MLQEDYFMYVEDLEYCSRVQDAGYKLHSIARSRIYHKVGATTGGATSEFSVYWRVRNMNKYLKSHGSVFQKVASLTLFNLESLLRLLFMRKPSLLASFFKGLLNR